MATRAHLLRACLLLLVGLLQSEAWEVAVKDDSNRTCIYASMFMNFTIEYETKNGTTSNATLVFPDKVKHDGSMCGNETFSPLLFVNLDNGHSWSLNFTKYNNETYVGSVITFMYNTSDALLFPEGKPNGTIITETPAVPQLITSVPLKSKYKCSHPDMMHTGKVVQIYWNITLQAYIENGTIGDNVTVCSADQPTAAPIPSTAAPTSAPPKPTPSKPTTGSYSIKQGNDTCLLATMGLQLNLSQINWIFNINPNTTNRTGSCTNQTANMTLTDSSATIEFCFVHAKGHFHLSEVHILWIANSSDSFHNRNLSVWDATVGSSYMCLREQIIEVVKNVSINAFDVRVQPFHVQNGKFSTAQECSLDDDGILIPIIVGAALLGLIVIIVIAYIIGRRKSYAGYQTL